MTFLSILIMSKSFQVILGRYAKMRKLLTDRQADRQTDRPTDRQTDKQREREREREREIENKDLNYVIEELAQAFIKWVCVV